MRLHLDKIKNDMKKLLLIFFLILLVFSCSKDEKGETNETLTELFDDSFWTLQNETLEAIIFIKGDALTIKQRYNGRTADCDTQQNTLKEGNINWGGDDAMVFFETNSQEKLVVIINYTESCENPDFIEGNEYCDEHDKYTLKIKDSILLLTIVEFIDGEYTDVGDIVFTRDNSFTSTDYSFWGCD
tara:strand:+ start:2142 stop:2699 length:558 start_codon:yes stop_codon:yes gene_type:complete